MTTTAVHDLTRDLARVLEGPDARDTAWRWSVRRRLGLIGDCLRAGPASSSADPDAWLSARSSRADTERASLLRRLDRLAAQVLVAPDTDVVAARLRRLLADVRRHHQRLHDLAYDDVELEIGGSE